MKVKALYHFLDKAACRNRKKGDIFDPPEKIAKELIKAGLVVPLDAKPKTETTEKADASKDSPEPKTKKNQKE